ncbi:MAG: transketolase, partial [Spirochaetales bacterium]
MEKLEKLKPQFSYWEKTKDIADNLLDIMLNYRQSGHPGGSRSKMHAFLTTLLSGAMRWDLRHPEKRFADRFVLGAGHTVPMVYVTLAILNEALDLAYAKTKNPKYLNPQPKERILRWEDLLKFRRRGGLSGHAEFSGKTLFLKANTGPSGHGSPFAAGIAVALKRAGVDAKVFIMEGEGGLTPGATHETANSAWGLALDNLYYLVDWNDFGIDDHPVSTVVYGTPKEWFGAHGWRVYGTEKGSDWEALVQAMEEMFQAPNPAKAPTAFWFKTRKGREYGKFDYASHGVPHSLNSEAFWATKKPFAEKYGVSFQNFGGPAPKDPAALAN